MRQSSGGGSARLILGAVIALISLISYFGSSEFNPVTGEQQFVSLTVDQEIALGIQSAPSMVEQYGGLYQNSDIQNQIRRIGNRLVQDSVAGTTPWEFQFYVLDSDVINAFALPGGPVFITTGLLFQLESEDAAAGVIAHEIVHVLARHSAQRIAKSDLTNGMIGAVGVASGDRETTQAVALIGNLVNMQYGRDDEIESDTLGVCLMISAGYNPDAMVDVMEVLAQAGGGSRQPEFFSTHPNPDNRIGQIERAISNASQDCP
jgi:predicted Zn-dependent protease